MASSKQIRAPLAAQSVLLRAPALAASALATLALAAPALVPALAPAASASPQAAMVAASTGSLLRSRQLWATIDVCNPFDQPDAVGIRGSMPGDGKPRDTMYMRFRVEFLDPATKRWTSRGQSPFVAVGTAKVARQGGLSFQFVPSAGSSSTLRGVVSYQWRRGATVLQTASRTTTAGRQSLAGADPPKFSAATCVIS
jgi:hypothetical protein